jgi:hypothetical protein
MSSIDRARHALLAAVAVCVALSLAHRVRAADAQAPPAAPPTTAAPAAPPPEAPAEVEEATKVEGEFPETLAGRWLFVGVIKPQGPVPLTRLLEIRPGAEHLQVHLNFGELPPEMNQRVQAVGAGNTWVPTPDDLAEIARRWDELKPPSYLQHGKIEHELLRPDAYPSAFNEQFKGTDFTIVTRESFVGKNPVKSTFTVYGVREQTPDGLAGNFASISVAAAPFPIPIAVQGDFKAYRLAEAPPPGFLEWLLDWFRGCGRST